MLVVFEIAYLSEDASMCFLPR